MVFVFESDVYMYVFELSSRIISFIQQLLSAGCVEHVDFASSAEILFDTDVFEEVSSNAMVPRLKVTTEPIEEIDLDVVEV